MYRWTVLALAACGLLAAAHGPLSAQRLSATVAYSRNAYGGGDYAVAQALGIGLQAEVMHLSLARDEDLVGPTIGDREGWRYSIGLALTVGRR